jgi:hypothetical protein
MKKILILSGPPGCGKDTAGNAIAKRTPVLLEKLSAPLKAAVPAFLGVPFEQLEKQKDEPVGFGRLPSFRQMQIDLSEKWAKQLYGDDIFAYLLADRLHRAHERDVVITDCGFRAELDHLVRQFGMENVMFVRIYRDGCDYAKDSRSHFGLPSGMTWVYVANNGSIDSFETEVSDLACRYFGGIL